MFNAEYYIVSTVKDSYKLSAHLCLELSNFSALLIFSMSTWVYEEYVTMAMSQSHTHLPWDKLFGTVRELLPLW